MLYYTLWDDAGSLRTYGAGLDRLRGYQLVWSEIRQLVKSGVAASKHGAKGVGVGLQHIPLLLQATYRREEILAALQYGSRELGKNMQHRERVARCPATNTDAFLVTLDKDEKSTRPPPCTRTTPSPELFHWKSQNATSPGSPANSPDRCNWLAAEP